MRKELCSLRAMLFLYSGMFGVQRSTDILRLFDFVFFSQMLDSIGPSRPDDVCVIVHGFKMYST